MQRRKWRLYCPSGFKVSLHLNLTSLVPVNSPPMCGRLAVRMQMARDLLSGELRILKSASMWLKGYCTTLTTTAYHCEDVGDYRAIPG
ncbi:hypothetical protein RGQ29_006678 [Quercus rubra]|uniref:Uncharacterized protein n=1 Tax=Quercus rubra TaxID=3512 RepID=A0AAN7E7J3_QUERU|nr:hypothetical protein RGQ29_006678 [Quercus rubra]